MVLGHDTNLGQRTQDVKILENVSFDTMLLNENTLMGLKKSGFCKPSPIQLHGIPLGKCGFDLLLEAKSGTGKTAVFTVIALEKLDLSQALQTIILAPTREIASQICDVITVIGTYYKGLNVAVVMGGLPVKEDIEKFQKNVHIVVGSPGRLRHLIEDKHIDISSVRLLVLDEADKLMEQSFLRDINYIFSLLPKQKQVVMSSATYPEETKAFISKYVKKAQHICPDSNSILLGIEQKVIIVPYNCHIVKQTRYRYEEIKKILSNRTFKQCLIFCNYQVRVAEVHRLLTRDKWPSEQLYGLQDQNDRLGALKTLQEYKCRILVSTDLAARGIDASNVDLVVNFEPPYEWQTYLHRIGRAGRYGSYGLAISILSEGKEKSKFIETLELSNMSFNLSHYWSDEPFNVNTSEYLENNIMTNGNSLDAESIISDPNEKKYQDFIIETDEQSNDSKQEISSFEELLDSFKMSSESTKENGHQQTDKLQNLNYKHVKIPRSSKVPITLMKNGNGHCPEEIGVQSMFEVKNIDVDNFRVTNHKNLDNNKSDLPHYTNRAESKAADHHRKYKNSEEKNNQNGIDVNFDKNHTQVNTSRKNLRDNKNNPSEQALIEAGLPIAFGKPKYNQRVPAKHVNRYNCVDDIEKESNETGPITHDHYKEIKTNKHHVSGYSKTNHKQPSDPIAESDQSTESNDSDYSNGYDNNKVKRRNKEFDNWYNQLRWQSQYLQYALYLEELKKL